MKRKEGKGGKEGEGLGKVKPLPNKNSGYGLDLPYGITQCYLPADTSIHTPLFGDLQKVLTN